jgi:hypothetical protein
LPSLQSPKGYSGFALGRTSLQGLSGYTLAKNSCLLSHRWYPVIVRHDTLLVNRTRLVYNCVHGYLTCHQECFKLCVACWISARLSWGLLYRDTFNDCSFTNHSSLSESHFTNADSTSSRNSAVPGRLVPWTLKLARGTWMEGSARRA